MKPCALVVIGVNEGGEKHFLAIEDGATGFWATLDEVYPEARQQRYWMHKMMNVHNYLPKSTQAKVKQSLHEIWPAEIKEDAEKAFNVFVKLYEPRYPKTAISLQKDHDGLL